MKLTDESEGERLTCNSIARAAVIQYLHQKPEKGPARMSATTVPDTLQAVLDVVQQLTDESDMATRADILAALDLSPHIIKERLDELIAMGRIKRRERGVYQFVKIHPPARAISRTVLPDGLAVIEVGDTVLHLTPREEAALRSMYVGPAIGWPR